MYDLLQHFECLRHFHINTLGKGMNPILPLFFVSSPVILAYLTYYNNSQRKEVGDYIGDLLNLSVVLNYYCTHCQP